MARPDLEQDVEIGDFRIEKRLGAGGMGIVYQARQISLNRVVALKILGNALTGSADMARFRREAQAAAKLEHPGIARIYFVGQNERLCYLAMELIKGEALQTLIARCRTRADAATGIDAMLGTQATRPLAETVTRFDVPDTAPDGPPTPPPAQADSLPEPTQKLLESMSHIRRCCELVREAAHILDYAHKQGVIHRDIKPANLMLDTAGHVHVIDFGIARFFEDATLTHTGQLVGTPMYMSPEQLTGRFEPDPRTDIYALGLVLYELLTLRPPLTAPNREELLRRIIAKPLAPLSRANASLPNSLEAIVHKATAKDRDERYATAKAFAEDLERFANGESVLAPPYRYRLDEREIRASRPAWAIVALLLYSFVGMVALLFFVILVGQRLERGITGVARPDAGETENAVGLLMVAGLFFAGAYGVLTARKWGRLVGIGIAPVTLAGLAYFGYELLSPGADRNGGIIGLFCICSVLCVAFIGIAYKLLTREGRDWFALAARIRAEHRSTAA